MKSSRLRICLGLLLLGLSRLGAVRADEAQPQSVPPGTWGADGVVVEQNVMVRMRDGVRLATDIYLPAHDGRSLPGRFPTLLERTPYGKTPPPITPGAQPADQIQAEHEPYYFASHGYAVVVQDCRGTFDSQGDFRPYRNEGRDGYDTLEWAARQPWSNGKVATFGGSYLAATQNALAVLHPPHLVAMFIEIGASDYYEEGAYRGGEFALLHNLAYALALGATSHDAIANPAERVAMLDDLKRRQLAAWLLAYPFAPGASPLSLSPSMDRWFEEMAAHPTFDDYWRRNGYDFERRYQRIPDVPIYFQSGWYDLFERGSLRNFAALSRLHHAPTRLLLGPWTHGSSVSTNGDVDFGPSARVNLVELQRRWFDRVLQGRRDGILSSPRVRYFVMGGGSGLRDAAGKLRDGGQWQVSGSWPPVGEKSVPFYLDGKGLLTRRAPGAQAPTPFIYDPRDPVPTIGGQIASGADFSPQGPQDQRCRAGIPFCTNDLPLSARHDVLVFETPPLPRDVVIAGPVSVDLGVSSSAPDTDFTAKLIDQAPPNADYPSGYAMNLQDGIIRMGSASDRGRMRPLGAGEIREVKIDLLAVANRFVKGHRIRLDVSSSNFPFFAVNPNTAEPRRSGARPVRARNTVYHDGAHPSHVNLPLLPAAPIPQP